MIDPACFDSNPASWHLAIINRVGAAHRSLVFDASADYQVWNQPVVSYRLRYFNPQSGKIVKTLSEAAIATLRFSADKFKEYRSPRGKEVVGIAMDLTYVSETAPSQALTDSIGDDSFVTVTYLYDLELDSRGEVVGGEWYSNAHPDFLWRPDDGVRVATAEDAELDSVLASWDGSSPIPDPWREAALSAIRRGVPLAHIVEALVALSSLPSH